MTFLLLIPFKLKIENIRKSFKILFSPEAM